MGESCREHRPLLCDDYSDEEIRIRKSNSKIQRLFRHSPSSGRARSQIIGAAALITRWPDHFSSLLTYWWIGLGMIAFMILIIYNSVAAVAFLPPSHLKPLKYQNKDYNAYITSQEVSGTNIFMHIFVNNFEELNMLNYLPYIDVFSKKHSNFKYNLIIILKDISNNNTNDFSDELNNELALSSLWIEKKRDDQLTLGKNIHLQIVSLRKYMDDSPIKKYWQRMPQQFFGFLTRCISIWEKGGIAFNPLILTPNSPNSNYVRKLEHILTNLGPRKPTKSLKKDKLKIHKKKINNIQDIIDNIENQDKSYAMQDNLLEAENKNIFYKTDNLNIKKEKGNTKSLLLEKYPKRNLDEVQQNKTKNDHIKKDAGMFSEEYGFNNLSTKYEVQNINQVSDNVTTNRNILPMFLEYLFHKPQIIMGHTDEKNNTISINTPRKYNRNFTSKEVKIKNQRNNPIIMTPLEKKGIDIKNININEITSENENNVTLRIDLQGNLIATETPCHAFIGTIFSNVVHHSNEESITDFIISELSIFCKGVLSSCKGIEVILL